MTKEIDFFLKQKCQKKLKYGKKIQKFSHLSLFFMTVIFNPVMDLFLNNNFGKVDRFFVDYF